MKVFDLKAFRKGKKITQKEIAEIFSCNQNFISRIESGIRRLPADKMEILKSVYGDISEYYKEDLEPLQKQSKQVQMNDDSTTNTVNISRDSVKVGGDVGGSIQQGGNLSEIVEKLVNELAEQRRASNKQQELINTLIEKLITDKKT